MHAADARSSALGRWIVNDGGHSVSSNCWLTKDWLSELRKLNLGLSSDFFAAQSNVEISNVRAPRSRADANRRHFQVG